MSHKPILPVLPRFGSTLGSILPIGCVWRIPVSTILQNKSMHKVWRCRVWTELQGNDGGNVYPSIAIQHRARPMFAVPIYTQVSE